MGVAYGFIAFAEIGGGDIAHAEAAARHLVGICRTDAFASGAYAVGALAPFAGGIEKAVGRENQMGLAGDTQAAVEIHAIGFKSLGLAAEKHRVEHDSVANEVEGIASGGENTRRNGAQHMLAAVELQRVPCIGAALETGYKVVLGSEHVHYLTFSFIAPLEP